MTAPRPTVLAAYWVSRAARALQRAGWGLEGFTSAAADALLTSEDKRALTARVYDDLPTSKTALFDWERAWFEQDLPKAPARILIGGCGRGREASALLARGYEVWAFDPSLDSVRQCEREAVGASFVGWFGYEQLVQSLAPGVPPHRRLLPADVRFDAVLLGWGSLSHVIDEREHEALLRVLSELAPSGPILASFYLAHRVETRTGRATRLGERVGELLGGQHASSSPARVRMRASTGFTYTFDEPRLHELAVACRREVSIHRDLGFPHATFKRA